MVRLQRCGGQQLAPGDRQVEQPARVAVDLHGDFFAEHIPVGEAHGLPAVVNVVSAARLAGACAVRVGEAGEERTRCRAGRRSMRVAGDGNANSASASRKLVDPLELRAQLESAASAVVCQCLRFAAPGACELMSANSRPAAGRRRRALRRWRSAAIPVGAPVVPTPVPRAAVELGHELLVVRERLRFVASGGCQLLVGGLDGLPQVGVRRALYLRDPRVPRRAPGGRRPAPSAAGPAASRWLASSDDSSSCAAFPSDVSRPSVASSSWRAPWRAWPPAAARRRKRAPPRAAECSSALRAFAVGRRFASTSISDGRFVRGPRASLFTFEHRDARARRARWLRAAPAPDARSASSSDWSSAWARSQPGRGPRAREPVPRRPRRNLARRGPFRFQLLLRVRGRALEIGRDIAASSCGARPPLPAVRGRS